MLQPIPATAPSLLARLLRALLLTKLKGKHRLTAFLARKIQALQTVPITIADWSPVYIDLRFINTHQWLMGNPWQAVPRETDEQAVMQQMVRPGDIVLDIGANLGLHMALLSRLVGDQGQVIAFEPNPTLLPALRKTIAHLNNVFLYPYALSNKSAMTNLYVPPHNPDVASLADWTDEEYGETHTESCEQQRLDELIELGVVPYPQFIKCDVEGAELNVFQGAIATLDRVNAPIILFESNIYTVRGFEIGRWDAMEFLLKLQEPKYQIFEVQADGKLTASLSEGTHANLLAIPAAKLSKQVG
jgi:FkbM family methyltransferase